MNHGITRVATQDWSKTVKGRRLIVERFTSGFLYPSGTRTCWELSTEPKCALDMNRKRTSFCPHRETTTRPEPERALPKCDRHLGVSIAGGDPVAEAQSCETANNAVRLRCRLTLPRG